MRKNKIPTYLGLIILVIGLIAGLILVRAQQLFTPDASLSNAPKDVRITNVSDKSFTVTWVTERDLLGFVSWGTSQSLLNKNQNAESNVPTFTHTVTVNSLSPQTTYFFKINSGGEEYDNNGTFWQITTGPTLAQTQPALVSGVIKDENGETVPNALVYLNVGGGATISTLTSTNGTWVTSISEARSQNLDSYIVVTDDTLIDIFVNAGPFGISTAKTTPSSAKPTPDIVLGKTLDFRNISINVDDQTPGATIDLPEQSERTSKFNVGDITDSSEKVTLDSIVQGEVVNTQTPEFFGEGPENTTITVLLESEVVNDTLTVGSDGKWKWSPPAGLTPGLHKITLSWKNSEGITQTIIRNFVVQAAEGPAFESTPSGSLETSSSPSIQPTLTPTPSPLSSPTINPSPSPIATDSGLLDSGSLTPTIVLFMMGIGVIATSVLIWKKSDY